MSLHENLVDRLENVEKDTTVWRSSSETFIAGFTQQLMAGLHWPRNAFVVEPKRDLEALGLYFTIVMTLADGADRVERRYRCAVSSTDGVSSVVFLAPEGAKKFPGGHKVSLADPVTLKPIADAIEKDFAATLGEMKETHKGGHEAEDAKPDDDAS